MDVTWLVMPVTYSGWTPKPKYPIDDDAVVIYRDRRAYVGLRTHSPDAELSLQPDVHEVTAAQVEELQASSVINLAEAADQVLAHRDESGGNRMMRAARRIGLGDAVAVVTRRLGISECSGCARRRRRLNRIRVLRFAGPNPS